LTMIGVFAVMYAVHACQTFASVREISRHFGERNSTEARAVEKQKETGGIRQRDRKNVAAWRERGKRE